MTLDVSAEVRDANDRLLGPLIEAADERAREQAIEELVADHVKPLIAGVLQRCRRVEPALRIEDLEEIGSLVALRFVQRVRAAAVSPERAIQSVESYVATQTYNAVHDLRRRRYPERHRLKRNLRYVLAREPAFALWEIAESAIAGLARWRGQPPRPAEVLTRRTATRAMTAKDRPIPALQAIFERLGHPIVFDALVDLVADLWEVRDVAVASEDDLPPDERPDQLDALEQRQYMEALWSEIRALPENQRKALLLNLRESARTNALTLFLLLNIADVAEIAAAAGLTEAELNEIWDELPMDDLAIAARLELTRQQVIDLRRSARMRLARRMAKWK